MKSIEELEKEYRKRTPTSLKCFERAKKNIPLGVNSNFQAYDPYPIFWDYAKGNMWMGMNISISTRLLVPHWRGMRTPY